MTELWQLYDEDGEPIKGGGATSTEILKGILHGGAHVWMWRINDGVLEILLQKRAIDKNTWPGYWDISAAGHIDFGEEPIVAALREVKEEIGVDINPEKLNLIAKRRDYLVAPNGAIENEFRWVYSCRISDDVKFELYKEEVADIAWMTLDKIRKMLDKDDNFLVPQGAEYFDVVFGFIAGEAELADS